MKKAVRIIAALIAIALVIWFAVLYTGPEKCPLCDFIKSHAPCLVNMKTGEVRELDLYIPHERLVGEIAEVQDAGIFSFLRVAGAEGTKMTAPAIIELDVPVIREPVFKYHFCRECRKLLADQGGGYALADLYVHGEPVVIPIADGMEQELRCYAITAAMNEEEHVYELVIKGTYEE